jgi:hypothetical protein
MMSLLSYMYMYTNLALLIFTHQLYLLGIGCVGGVGGLAAGK